MAIKDYYLILGVPRGESATGIHQAFRELAKRFHPDRAGAEGIPDFQRIKEAYEVLSDPQRRSSYNEALRRAESRAAPEPEPITDPGIGAPEPLEAEPISIMRDFERYGPSREAIRERFRRNFTGRDLPKSEHAVGLHLDAILSPAEAARGGLFEVAVPAFRRCPACGGSGHDWAFPCLHCGASGMVEVEEVVPVRIPPGTRSGTVLEIPLRYLGIHNFYLRIRLRVSRV